MYPVKIKGKLWKVFHTPMCSVGVNIWRRWVLEVIAVQDMDGRNVPARRGLQGFLGRLIFCLLRFEGAKGNPSGVEEGRFLAQTDFDRYLKRLNRRLPRPLVEVPAKELKGIREQSADIERIGDDLPLDEEEEVVEELTSASDVEPGHETEEEDGPPWAEAE